MEQPIIQIATKARPAWAFCVRKDNPTMTTTTPRRPVKGVETITLARLLAHQFPTREALIFPWLRQGESAMLWAAPGTGKTLLTLTLAVLVAGGGTVLGWSADKPRKVLLVDGEMSAEDLQERVRWLIGTVAGIDPVAAGVNLSIMSRNWQPAEVAFPDLGEREATRRGRKAGQDVVFEAAQRCGAELVLCDNFSTLVELADENDAASMTATLAFLLRLKQARIGCVLVHHSGKDGGTYRGSSKLATTFEAIIGLKPIETGVVLGGAAFRLEWSKYRREPCEAVQPREVRLGKDAAGNAEWQAAATMDDDTRALLAELKTGKHATQRSMAEALGWDPSKVTKVKISAISAGRISLNEWAMWQQAGTDAEF